MLGRGSIATRALCGQFAVALFIAACGSEPIVASETASDGSSPTDVGVSGDATVDGGRPIDADSSAAADTVTDNVVFHEAGEDVVTTDVAIDVGMDVVADVTTDVGTDVVSASDASDASDSATVSVTISPTSATVPGGKTKLFAATVSGTTNQGVTWSVKEASGGSISSSGLYTAPTANGVFHVVATASAAPNPQAVAVVKVWYGTFTTLSTSLSVARGLFTSLPHSITASDGRILFIAGGTSTAQSALDVYSGNSLVAGSSLATTRSQPGAVALPDGSVLAIGGGNGTQSLTPVSSIERWDPSTGQWTTLATPLTTARLKPPIARMLDGRVFVVSGGLSSSTFASSIEGIDPGSNFLVWNAGTVTLARSGHVATPLADGRILIAGGATGGTPPVATELFTPAANGLTGTITAGPNLSVGHIGFNAARLPNGGALLIAGCSGGGTCPTVVGACDAYTPVTGAIGTFVATGSLNTPSGAHAAILLATGRVLVAGGYNASTGITRAEIYDPATGEWTTVGSLQAARYDAGIALTRTGKVIIAGGRTGPISGTSTYLSSAEIFDPGLPTNCKICQLDGSCITLETGTPCDDGNEATTGETCNAANVCAL